MMNNQQEIATPDINRRSKVRAQSLVFGTTKWLTYTAMFTALALATKLIGQFLTLTPDFKITPVYVIWLVAAAALGPFGGGAVCFISDILGALIVPRGAINPLLSLGCTMYGIIAGLTFKYLPIKNNAAKLLISGVVCTVLITLIFDSFAIWAWTRYYLKLIIKPSSPLNKPFWVYVGIKRTMQLAVGAVNIAVTVAMTPLLSQLRLIPEKHKYSKSKTGEQP